MAKHKRFAFAGLLYYKISDRLYPFSVCACFLYGKTQTFRLRDYYIVNFQIGYILLELVLVFCIAKHKRFAFAGLLYHSIYKKSIILRHIIFKYFTYILDGTAHFSLFFLNMPIIQIISSLVIPRNAIRNAMYIINTVKIPAVVSIARL